MGKGEGCTVQQFREQRRTSATPMAVETNTENAPSPINEEVTSKDVSVDHQQTALNGVLPPVNSTCGSGFVVGTLAPFDGATEVEATDDPGCALVSLNTAMIESNFEPFSLEEVLRAHEDVVRAQTGNATSKYSPAEWTKYIGNPDDGGAMSQGHVQKLLKNRFGDGNYEFRRVDKNTLLSDTSVDGHYIVTGVMERALFFDPGHVEVVYGSKVEIKDTLTQNMKFQHTIYVNPGHKYFICKNKRDDIGVYTQLSIDWLKLKSDGNPERGGYMRHIHRVFKISVSIQSDTEDESIQQPAKRARTM